MNGKFFALAFTAALNPKLLALDLLLIGNRRARAMFAADVGDLFLPASLRRSHRGYEHALGNTA